MSTESRQPMSALAVLMNEYLDAARDPNKMHLVQFANLRDRVFHCKANDGTGEEIRQVASRVIEENLIDAERINAGEIPIPDYSKSLHEERARRIIDILDDAFPTEQERLARYTTVLSRGPSMPSEDDLEPEPEPRTNHALLKALGIVTLALSVAATKMYWDDISTWWEEWAASNPYLAELPSAPPRTYEVRTQGSFSCTIDTRTGRWWYKYDEGWREIEPPNFGHFYPTPK